MREEEGLGKERDLIANNEVKGKDVGRRSCPSNCRILVQSLPDSNHHTALHRFPLKSTLTDYSVSTLKKPRSLIQLRLSAVEDRSTRLNNSVVV